MTTIVGDVVDHAGRPVSGSLTLTPTNGSPVAIRVRLGLIDRAQVASGAYELTGSVRAVGDVYPTLLPPRPVTVAGTRTDLSCKAPGPSPVSTGGDLSIVEVSPGVYQVTGASVAETSPGTYSLTV